MNAFTANDLEAADVEAAALLALARLDDDGAPCPSSLARSQLGSSDTDSDRGAGNPASTIAALPGRPRQQLTPALMGVG